MVGSLPERCAVAEHGATGTLRLPPRVHFGYGTGTQRPGIVRVHGRRVLAVVDPFLTRTPFFADPIGA